jgi:hypothetical protein
MAIIYILIIIDHNKLKNKTILSILHALFLIYIFEINRLARAIFFIIILVIIFEIKQCYFSYLSKKTEQRKKNKNKNT